MKDVLKSPDWLEIDAEVNRQYWQHRRAVFGISVLAAIQMLVPAAKLGAHAVQTEWNELQNGLVFMQRYPHVAAASTPETNPLFDPQAPAIELSQAEVDAVLDTIHNS